MKKEFIDFAPVFSITQSIQDLLHHLLQNNITSQYIIVCDEKQLPFGVVHLGKLYEKIAFGRPFDSLESLCDTNFTVLPQDSEFINPESLTDNIIVVTDKNNFAIGIVKNSMLLLDYIQSGASYDTTSDNSFFASLESGFVLADIHGHILSLNSSAKKIFHKAGISYLRCIDDLIPRFSYSTLRQNYTLSYKNICLQIQSYPFFHEGKTPQIALLIFNISAENANKKALSDLKIQYKELLEIMENSYDEIYVTDSNGICIFINKACERIYGLRREDILGKTSAQMKLSGFISSDLSEKVIQTKQRICEIQTTKIGQKIMVIASPIFDKNNEVRKVVINSREITDMLDVRISADNLKLENNFPITDRIMELTLKSNKIVAESPNMKALMHQISRISQTDSHVLLIGESGSGKNVIATLIHELSRRRNHSLVRLDCSALSEPFAESLLWGDEFASSAEKSSSRLGLFSLADQSTLLLDNIDELSYQLQGKLLHVIDDMRYTPSGKNYSVNIDFRLIATTRKDILTLIQKGVFRKELYYRLNGMYVKIPPLREHKKDIPFLIQKFLNSVNKTTNLQKNISPQAVERLMEYSWPGNIRELQNVIERLYLLSSCPQITKDDLSLVPEFSTAKLHSINTFTSLIGKKELPAILDSFEKELLIKAMEVCDSTYSLAKLMGISQATAVRKLQKHCLKF